MPRQHRVRAWGAALATLCLLIGPQAGPASAEESVKAGQVVVSATRTEKELRETASAISVVTQEDIERSPAPTVADLLRDVPGVQVHDQSVAGVKRVTIRGESPARVLILVDGQKISEQKSMDGAALLMDPSDIERIEVVKGPASVQFGSEAIGGVINIITKKGGERPIQAEVAETYDSSVDGFTEYLSVYGSSNGFNYRVSGSYTDAGDRWAEKGRISDSSYLNRNFSAYLDKQFGDYLVGARWESFWSNENIPTAESDGAVVELDLPEWSRDKYALFLERDDIGEYLRKVRLDLAYQSTFKKFNNDIDPPGPVSIRLRTKNWQDTTSASAQFDWTLGQSHYVVSGVEYSMDDLKARERKSVSFPPPGTDTTYTNKAWQETYALFVQDEWNFAEDWVLTAGLRETLVRSELESSEDPGLEEGSSTGNRPVGSLGLVYSGFDNWRLRAQYSQGYRYPNLQQLFIGTAHGSANPTYGNPNLEAETSDNFELGARFNDGAWDMDATLFYMMAENYITTVDAGGGARRFDNVNEASGYGAEVTLSYAIDSLGLTPYMSGTWLRREYETSTYTTKQTGDPSFMERFGVRYHLDFAQDMLFTADAYTRLASQAKELSGGDVLTYNSWQTYNLALALQWGEARRYSVSLNLNNLTDEDYSEAGAVLDSPGRSAVVRVGLKF